MMNKKFDCLEIDRENKIFIIEPDTFTASNRVIYDGTITDTDDGYIITGDQQVSSVHDKDWSPTDPEKVHPTFVKEIEVVKTKWKWTLLFGILPWPYTDKTKSIKKEVKKGWILLKEREPVTITICEKFSQIIEIKKKTEEKRRYEEDEKDVKDE